MINKTFIFFVIVIMPQVGSSLDLYSDVLQVEIPKESIFEKTAFGVLLNVVNIHTKFKIKDVEVKLIFKDENSNISTSFEGLDESTAKFKYVLGNMSTNKVTSLVKNEIDVGDKLTYAWYVVPMKGTANNTINGKLYYVSAVFKYSIDGKVETVLVKPDSIFIKNK